MSLGLGLGLTDIAMRGGIGGFPSLNLQSDRNLEEYPLVNFTRSGIKRYVDQNGVLQTALANTLPPSYKYNPSSGLWEKGGWLPEKDGTNMILDSRDMTTGNWINDDNIAVRDEVGLDGVVNTANTLTDDNASGNERVAQTIIIPDDSNTHTVSFWIKKDSDISRFPLLVFTVTGGTTIDVHQIYFDTSDGSKLTRSGTDTFNVEDKGDWWFIWVTATNNGTGNTTAIISIYPAWTDTFGSDSPTTGSIIADQVQVELNTTFPSSPIITQGSQVSRPPDIGNITDLEGMGFNQSEGTIVAEFYPPPQFTNGNRLWSLDDNTVTNRFHVDMSSTSIRLFNSGGNNAGIAWTPNKDTLYKLSCFYTPTEIGMSLGGAVETVSTTVLDMSLVTHFQIGNLASNFQYSSYIKSLKYYPKRLAL